MCRDREVRQCHSSDAGVLQNYSNQNCTNLCAAASRNRGTAQNINIEIERTAPLFFFLFFRVHVHKTGGGEEQEVRDPSFLMASTSGYSSDVINTACVLYMATVV